MSEHDLEVTKIGDSSYLRLKVKHIIIAVSTALTLLGTAAGWIIHDYTTEFAEHDKKDEKFEQAIEKIDDRLDMMNGNIMFIRGQVGNVVRHDASSTFEPSTPNQIIIPSN